MQYKIPESDPLCESFLQIKIYNAFIYTYEWSIHTCRVCVLLNLFLDFPYFIWVLEFKFGFRPGCTGNLNVSEVGNDKCLVGNHILFNCLHCHFMYPFMVFLLI